MLGSQTNRASREQTIVESSVLLIISHAKFFRRELLITGLKTNMLESVFMVCQSVRLCLYFGHKRNAGEDSWSSLRTRNYTSIKPSDEQANGGRVVLLEMNAVLLSLLKAPVQSFVEVVRLRGKQLLVNGTGGL